MGLNLPAGTSRVVCSWHQRNSGTRWCTECCLVSTGSHEDQKDVITKEIKRLRAFILFFQIILSILPTWELGHFPRDHVRQCVQSQGFVLLFCRQWTNHNRGDGGGHGGGGVLKKGSTIIRFSFGEKMTPGPLLRSIWLLQNSRREKIPSPKEVAWGVKWDERAEGDGIWPLVGC